MKGDTATWTGQLGAVTDLEGRFERGSLGRVWANIQDFLSKPVIKLSEIEERLRTWQRSTS
ncbi:MAG: hypothetical protein M3O88_09380 [Actinomycetota bacterium]|nr:hypothetical protein [Actinomycetota bacterium]